MAKCVSFSVRNQGQQWLAKEYLNLHQLSKQGSTPTINAYFLKSSPCQDVSTWALVDPPKVTKMMSQTNDCIPFALLTQALQLSEVLGPWPWSILGVAFFKLLIHGTMLFSICWYLFLPNLVHCLYIWIFILITMFPYFYLLIFLFSLLKFVVPTFFTPFSYCTYLFSLFHFYQLFASSHFFPNHCLPTSWQNHLLQTRKPHSLINTKAHPFLHHPHHCFHTT